MIFLVAFCSLCSAINRSIDAFTRQVRNTVQGDNTPRNASRVSASDSQGSGKNSQPTCQIYLKREVFKLANVKTLNDFPSFPASMSQPWEMASHLGRGSRLDGSSGPARGELLRRTPSRTCGRRSSPLLNEQPVTFMNKCVNVFLFTSWL